MKIPVSRITDDPLVNLALDTLQSNKQALIFVNTRRSTEKTAEDIAKKFNPNPGNPGNPGNPYVGELSNKALHSLSRPTKQCERLAHCLKKGIAFHHSGLTMDQKNLIEENFRSGHIRIICATTTLAYGLDLPAYRSIVRDLKRYGGQGMGWIPVLEVQQMFGRAGRPSFDKEGQALCIAGSESEKEEVEEKYIFGEPEHIYSKLASEPALRTYVLSLIASSIVQSKKEIVDFFMETFYALQYEDTKGFINNIERMLRMLIDWEFIASSKDDFVDASEMDEEKFKATLIGKRIAELYIDPYTAHFLIQCIKRAASKKTIAFSYLQSISHTLEMRPLLKVKVKESDTIHQHLFKYSDYLIEEEPSLYDPEYEDFLNSFKTSLMFLNWIDEKGEDYLLEQFDIRPGELKQKLDIADWLLYSMEELTRILHFQIKLKEIMKVRIRLRHGIREELLPLIQLENIGRIRARKLFANNIKDIGDVKKADLTKLTQILGKQIALDVKKQVGQDFSKVEVKENKRKGQISLRDY